MSGPRENMVVKEFLQQSGVDLNRFQNPYLCEGKARRRSLKMPGIYIDNK